MVSGGTADRDRVGPAVPARGGGGYGPHPGEAGAVAFGRSTEGRPAPAASLRSIRQALGGSCPRNRGRGGRTVANWNRACKFFTPPKPVGDGLSHPPGRVLSTCRTPTATREGTLTWDARSHCGSAATTAPAAASAGTAWSSSS